MSEKSIIITRSKSRQLAETSERREDMDLAPESVGAPISDTQATTSTSQPLSSITPIQRDADEETVRRTRSRNSRVSHMTSRSSRISSYSRKRVEYEQEIARREKEAIDEDLRRNKELMQLEKEAEDKKQKIDARVLRFSMGLEESSDDEEATQVTQNTRTEEWLETVSQHSSQVNNTVFCEMNAPRDVPASCAPIALDHARVNSDTSVIHESNASRDVTALRAPIAQDYVRVNSDTSVIRESNASRDVPVTNAPVALDSARVYNDVLVCCEPCVSRDVPMRRVDQNPQAHIAPHTHGEPAVTTAEPSSQLPGHVLAATRRPYNKAVACLPASAAAVMYEKETGRQKGEERQGEASSEVRDLKISQLTLEEALRNLSRPVPRQAYELPHFDGDPADWLSFKNMYEETTSLYKFKKHENLARLRTSLKGEAKDAVEDLLRTAMDPTDIMQVLENYFGHPTAILECALRKIRSLPKMSESGREIKKFSTAVRNCVSLLKHIRAEGYINNPQLFSELLGKLTPAQRAQYGDFAMKLDNKPEVDLRISPSLEILSKFLEHLSQAASYYVHASVAAATGLPLATSIVHKTPSSTQARRVKYAQLVHHVNVQSDAPTLGCENRGCDLCNEEHPMQKCVKFLELSVPARYSALRKYKRCFSCLNKGHFRRSCKAKGCVKCGSAHHELLHMDSKSKGDSVAESVTNVGETRAKALLKVIPITIRDVNDKSINVSCYALLDDGATVSLVDSSLTDNVSGGQILPIVIKSARGHETSDSKSRVVNVNIVGPNGQCHKVKCRTLSELNLPSQTVPAAVIKENAHLRDLGCEEMKGAKPLLLLGQDNWELLVSEEIRCGKSGKPVASLTKLGWVIHGPMGKVCNSSESENCMAMSLPDLHNVVKAQFELEAIGITEDPRKHRDVERATAILSNTSRRTLDGSQWEVGLLWKQDDVDLPDNYSYARQRLDGIEKKMRRDSIFAESYTNQVNRLISEGYARKVDGDFKASPVWYLPHFGVTNPNKPGKLRLVFDAAASFRGTCLNDNLLSGPDLLNSLLSVLFNFRIGPIGFAGDIADMFLRIRVRKEDQGAQLFLWRSDSDQKEPEVYAMNSMVFGAVSSPASAIYILNKNAEEFKEIYPEAVAAIRYRHYMDDYLDGAWTVEQANKLIEEVTHIHAAGGFVIRGWVTNSPELREKLQIEMPERVALDKGDHSTERTLGMIWSPGTDRLAFDLSFKRLPENIVTGKVIPTKREFLRFIMSIFDPLGFLYPCVIQSRILMQKIWKSGIQWDDRLNKAEADMWFKWLNNLHALQKVSIPRWYGLLPENLELHVFGDASELAYAAVAYLVGKNADGDREVAMVVGKARVAPQKVISIPRLELQAAVLASRLANTVEKEIKLPITNKFLWTDNKTVLKWICTEAHEFQHFVSHTLSEINCRLKRSNWRWVPSSENPADKATRFNWPSDCDEHLSGPSFLRNLQERWPACDVIEAPEEELERTHQVHATSTPAVPFLDHTHLSSWTRILRVIARAFVFFDRCRKRRSTPEIRAEDLLKAESYLLKSMQAESFPEDWKALQKDHPALYAVQETLVSNIRDKYWVTNLLRSTVKAVASSCQLCRIRGTKLLTYDASDTDQPVVLTFNYLLLGTASGSTPLTYRDPADVDSRWHWKKVNALADAIWKRWLREHLPTLQRRDKWCKSVPNVKVGDVVVLVDETKNRNEWLKGVIKTVHQGPDSIVRVVDVATVNGVLRRSVVKVVVLPTDNSVIG